MTLDVNAPSIEEQYEEIISAIRKSLNVSLAEAELYHYNSALKVIRALSTQQNPELRKITKSSFLERISVRNEIFDAWFIKRKGREQYIKSVKKECLSSPLNMSAFNRFFLIDCVLDASTSDLKEIVILLAKKWSKLSRRQSPRFCPIIYFNGLKSDELLKLKNSMYSEGHVFLDPYPFKGSHLSVQHFHTEPSEENKIKFKMVDSLEDLEKLIEQSKLTVEIYQFFGEKLYFNNEENKHVKIKIEDISYIKDLAK